MREGQVDEESSIGVSIEAFLARPQVQKQLEQASKEGNLCLLDAFLK